MADPVTWVTADDVAVMLGPPVDPTDPWLIEATAAANGWAFDRRAAAGYVDDPTVVPSARVKTGVVYAAAHAWRGRAQIGDTLAGLDAGTWTPGQWGDVNRFLGIPRPVAV